MLWDGLWHSHLSVNGNHIGTANWLLSAVPFICHDGERIDDALVIGLGTGITVGTLAKSDKVGSVDAYEIDRKLLTILRAYPEGSLHVADNPKVHIIWQDGRAGLAVNDKQYDLITQQPFYLKQAGSSILLSREYMELVKKRLKKKGVFCIYSNALGNQEQALLVRRTAASVFSYCESFGGGYMIVASNSPFAFHPERFKNVRRSDRLIEEICLVGVERLAGYLDSPRLEWNKCHYVITDDHPLVEYPGVVRSLLNRREECQKRVGNERRFAKPAAKNLRPRQRHLTWRLCSTTRVQRVGAAAGSGVRPSAGAGAGAGAAAGTTDAANALTGAIRRHRRPLRAPGPDRRSRRRDVRRRRKGGPCSRECGPSRGPSSPVAGASRWRESSRRS